MEEKEKELRGVETTSETHAYARTACQVKKREGRKDEIEFEDAGDGSGGG
ncbi:hypothetical protein [Pasteurella multocida]|nr:hypothetical protein [Pasteurella multocida]